MNKPSDGFTKLNAIFMNFHDLYEDIIADCDKDAFEILYDMHHNSFDHETLRNLFLRMYDKFGEILKSCSTELFEDLQKIIKQF